MPKAVAAAMKRRTGAGGRALPGSPTAMRPMRRAGRPAWLSAAQSRPASGAASGAGRPSPAARRASSAASGGAAAMPSTTQTLASQSSSAQPWPLPSLPGPGRSPDTSSKMETASAQPSSARSAAAVRFSGTVNQARQSEVKSRCSARRSPNRRSASGRAFPVSPARPRRRLPAAAGAHRRASSARQDVICATWRLHMAC